MNGQTHGSPNAIYPGSFDPLTLGHLDVIERAAAVFPRLLVAVVVNPQKREPLFTLDERKQMIVAATKHLRQRRRRGFPRLARRFRASAPAPTVIVKGLRVVSDFENEMSTALMNRSLSGIDTVFVPSDPKYSFVSSSLVKEVFFLGGEIDQYVPRSRAPRSTRQARCYSALPKPAEEKQTIVSIYRVLDKLEAYVRQGTVLPLKRRVLSEERLFEYIEKIRSTLPAEVGQAKLIAKDKDRVLREAQERAQAIVSDASEAHAAMVDDHEIVRAPAPRPKPFSATPNCAPNKVREGADAYAAQVLVDLDNRLSTALGSVKKGIDQLTLSRTAAAIASAPAPASQPLAEAAAKSKRAAFDAQAEPVQGETAQLESV